MLIDLLLVEVYPKQMDAVQIDVGSEPKNRGHLHSRPLGMESQSLCSPKGILSQGGLVRNIG